NAAWTNPDEKFMVVYLVEHVSEAGDGGNFKAKTFRALTEKLNAIRTRGGPKNARGCGQKYMTLRKLWNLVDTIKGISGWSWNDTTGVDVTPATQGTWDVYVAKFPDAK
ncbi:hypothetical protein FB451DRAFT_1004098, partial [Mycena latifolia]